jgi:hypothetical protein
MVVVPKDIDLTQLLTGVSDTQPRKSRKQNKPSRKRKSKSRKPRRKSSKRKSRKRKSRKTN